MVTDGQMGATEAVKYLSTHCPGRLSEGFFLMFSRLINNKGYL